jgi:hypothetical protein
MANPKPTPRFPIGSPAGMKTRFVKGQSGNPAGISTLQRRFEAWFYTALGNEATAGKAKAAFVKALARGEAWAHNLYWPRMLPAQAISLKVGREDDSEKIDYSRLTEAEFAELGRLLAKASESGPRVLESGQRAAQSTDLH